MSKAQATRSWADGLIDDGGRVRIEGVVVAALGTYAYQVLSIGSAALTGDLTGSIVVDGSDKPCPDGGGGSGGTGGDGGTGGVGGGSANSPFSGCVERPPPSIECECDPLNDNCSGNLECSINFFVDAQTQVITSVPALDGSDCCPATDCISNFIQTVGAGGACNIILAGTLRRDDCLPGLFCDPAERRDLRPALRRRWRLRRQFLRALLPHQPRLRPTRKVQCALAGPETPSLNATRFRDLARRVVSVERPEHVRPRNDAHHAGTVHDGKPSDIVGDHLVECVAERRVRTDRSNVLRHATPRG